MFRYVFLVLACLSLAVLGSPRCDVRGPRQPVDGVSSKVECSDKGLCWFNDARSKVGCYHVNGGATGYRVTQENRIANGVELELQLKDSVSMFGNDVPGLAVRITYEADHRCHVKITDSQNKRWEVPTWLSPAPEGSTTRPENLDIKISYTRDPFTFKVMRASDNAVLFETTHARPLVFEDQYLELSTTIEDNAAVYGLGERVHKMNLGNGVYPMWSLDNPTPVDQNLYGAHPFYMQMKDGKAHGVFLRNSNAQEVSIQKEILTFHTTGGVLDMYFFSGPNPEQVVQQYQELIGTPVMPPFWSLGWHQCRYGFLNFGELRGVMYNYRQNGIPLDTIWSDIDYMDAYKDFTWGSKFPQYEAEAFIKDVHDANQRYVVIVDPGIKNEPGYKPFEMGKQMDIFIKNPDGSPFIGKVWPGTTAYPDFLNPDTSNYWYENIREFLDGVPIDGLWIDMNEASNFCNGDCSGKTDRGRRQQNQYRINNAASHAPLDLRTVSMDAVHFGGVKELDAHSLYGIAETIATRKALERYYGKRAFVLTRSTFPGSGQHTAHWLGDNHATFESMRYSIAGALTMNILGVPFVGADICGFTDTAGSELCARWHAFGAFYPFARNHNSVGVTDQYPYTWPEVASITKKVLLARYSLLHYYYTNFYLMHMEGGTIMKPLFFEFSNDREVLDIDDQFLVGRALMVSPVLDQGAKQRNVYFPGARWFDFWTQKENYSRSKRQTVAADLDEIPVHIRGGHILPLQKPQLTTVDTVAQDEFQLIVAMSPTMQSSGYLYLDDGDDLDIGAKATLVKFEVHGNKLCSKLEQNSYPQASTKFINQITYLGISNMGPVHIDGLALHLNAEFCAPLPVSS